MSRVLVVDDDATVREVVVSYLRSAGHEVAEAADGATGLAMQRKAAADLVILDVMMPGLDGLTVARELRKTSTVPVVMLTALGGEMDRVAGLEIGADDYVTKPFSPRELVLRVDSILRRIGEAPRRPGGVLIDGDLRVDLDRHEVSLADESLGLTGREFDLLAHLVAHPGVAYTREELLADVWGWNFGDHSTVTVHVRRLREKIESDPAHPRRLATVWGVGYRWDPSETPRD